MALIGKQVNVQDMRINVHTPMRLMTPGIPTNIATFNMVMNEVIRDLNYLARIVEILMQGFYTHLWDTLFRHYDVCRQ